MSAEENLRALLEAVEDTRELMLAPPRLQGAELVGELFVAWSAARADANLALDAWESQPGSDAYAVFRAAEDRADAAEDALAEASARMNRPRPLAAAESII
jgi:hypothetical protein